MMAADPRLSKLAKMLALHDDPAATDGERAACRNLGEKIAADLGIEFSRAAIEQAGGFAHQERRASSYDFDIDAAMREWAAMTPEQREAAVRDLEAAVRDLAEATRQWRDEARQREAERAAADQERARRKVELDEAMRRRRKEEKAREEEEEKAEEAERDRLRRVKAGIEPPQWDDLDDDHIDWLNRIEAMALSDGERTLIGRIRAGVRNQCLGLYGDALARINAMMARAAAAGGA